MRDLISRQVVIDALELGLENDYVDATEFLTFIKQLPSAEPEERTAKVTDNVIHVICCEKCKRVISIIDDYCPRCGAKLDWSENDGLV